MQFRPQYQGSKFRVEALELDNGNCPAVEYLISLEARNKESHTRLLAVIKHHANSGPIKNPKQSRPLKGKRYDGLFEFKTPQGARLFYFYLPKEKGVTILTNGCDKGDPSKPCWEAARAYMFQLLGELKRVP